jgi:hypothetical protein
LTRFLSPPSSMLKGLLHWARFGGASQDFMADDASAGDVCIFVRSASAPRGLEAKMSDCRGIMCVFRVGMVGLDANDVERRRRVSDHMTMAHQSDSSAEGLEGDSSFLLSTHSQDAQNGGSIDGDLSQTVPHNWAHTRRWNWPRSDPSLCSSRLNYFVASTPTQAARDAIMAVQSELPQVKFIDLLAGWETFTRTGTALPRETVQSVPSPFAQFRVFILPCTEP